MDFLNQLSDSSLFSWVILPALIFISRIFDVSIGTLRIIYVSRGRKVLAPLLGFFEVSIWLLAISQIMQNLDNVVCFLAYAIGFAAGNLVGILIEEKLAMGTLIVRIFLIKDDCRMQERLYEEGFGVTRLNGHGKSGEVTILFSVIKRKDMRRIVGVIEHCQSNAFYSVEEAKSVRKGYYPSNPRPVPRRALRISRRTKMRKGK